MLMDVQLVFTHPLVDAYDNYANVWASPREADVDQYLKDQSGPFASASPRFVYNCLTKIYSHGGACRVHHWRAYTGADGKKRYVQSTTKVGGSV